MSSLDLDLIQARAEAAAAVVNNAADSIDGEWGDGSAYDVREAARFLGADVYAPDFDGIDLPALIAELRAAREFAERFDKWRLRGEQSYQSVLDARDAWLAAYDQVVGEVPR